MWYLLCLLLPVAAASGWYIGRFENRFKPTRLLPSDYFRGINFLLNEQPDKAVDVFIRMLEVDSDTVETHLALGNIFRRRGEVDRAIRIHQNVIARTNLSAVERVQALLELGQDYMRAGVLDRAESLFLELVALGEERLQGLKHLLEIYQQQRDWQEALRVAQQLAAESHKPMDALMAHYLCELAEEAEARGEMEKVPAYIQRALSFDVSSVRANLLNAKLAVRAGNEKDAIEIYKRIAAQHPEYLSEVLLPISRCYERLGQTEAFQQYLVHRVQEGPGMTGMLVLAENLAYWRHDKRIADLVINHLKHIPSVQSIQVLIDLYMDSVPTGVATEVLQVLRHLTAGLLENRTVYCCEHCGFTGKMLHWQCPQCKHWDTVKPLVGSHKACPLSPPLLLA